MILSELNGDWINIYERFKDVRYGIISVFKRRRELILKFPKNIWLTPKEIIESSNDLMRTYLRKSNLFLKRDLDELKNLDSVLNEEDKIKLIQNYY